MGPTTNTEVEQRQLAKVKSLTIDPAGHDHRINPKTGRRRSCPVCRLEKKKLRAERETRWLTALTEISKEVIREGVRGVAQFSTGVVQSAGHVAGRIAGSSGVTAPITILTGYGLSLGVLYWFAASHGWIAGPLKVRELADTLNVLRPENLKNVADAVLDPLNILGDTTDPGPPPVKSCAIHYWFDDPSQLPFTGTLARRFFTDEGQALRSFDFQTAGGLLGAELHKVEVCTREDKTTFTNFDIVIKKSGL